MQRVTFVNSRGESIELYQTPFFLNKIEGLGNVDADIQSQKAPGQDGSTYIKSFLAERFIPIEVVILKDLQINRQLISRVFNPKLGPGLLIYENDIVRREIMAVSEHVPKFFDERPRRVERVEIDLICNEPYWKSAEHQEQLVVWEGGLEFPLQLPTEFATQSSSNKTKLLVNEGDEETPISVTFNGPATAPIKITNKTTGEFIEINQSLLVGERLEINTAFGQKRVSKVLADGTTINVFHYINLDSTFFQLVTGNNLIDYSLGADYERAGVTIAWSNRYLGI